MMPEPNRFAILSEIGTGLGRIGLCSFARPRGSRFPLSPRSEQEQPSCEPPVADVTTTHPDRAWRRRSGGFEFGPVGGGEVDYALRGLGVREGEERQEERDKRSEGI